MEGKYYRKTAIIVGALFIIATVTAIAAMFLIGDLLDGPDFMLDLAGHENTVIAAAILELTLAVSLFGIGVLMFPVLKRWGEGPALGYGIFRMTEGVLIAIGTMSLLAMLTLGGDYADGTLAADGAAAMGALLMAIREWALVIGTLLLLGLGTMTLGYLLGRSRLVPVWLSVWAFVGGVCVLVYGILGLFGTDTVAFEWTTLLAAPIAVEEMVFASYLIIKGFRTPDAELQEGPDHGALLEVPTPHPQPRARPRPGDR